MVNNHVVGSTHQDFGLAVTVPVVAHGIILLVGSRHHVRPEVNPPQTVALDVVALDAVVGRVVGHRRAIGTVVALHDELAHAVAIHVGQGNVVDVVVVGNVGAPTGVQFLHGKLDVLLAEARYLGTLLLLHAAHHGGNLILRPCTPLGVGVIGHFQRGLVHLHAIAVKVVLRVVILFAEDAPAHERAASRRNGHHPTIQLVGRALCRCGATEARNHQG